MSIYYRQAEPADAGVLSQLGQEGEAGGAGADRMTRYLEGRHHPHQALKPRTMWIAFDDAMPIGYAAGHLTTRYSCDGELQWIYVTEKYRGAGVGRTLLQFVAHWFADSGAARVCVDVGDDRARGFYRTLGATDLNEHWMVWRDIAAVLDAADEERDPPLIAPAPLPVLSKPVRVVAGVVLLAWSALSAVGSIAILWIPNDNALLMLGMSVLLLTGSLWIMMKALRIMFSRGNTAGGLMSPAAFRGAGGGALVIAAYPLLAARDRPWPLMGLVPLAGLILFAVSMFRMASQRARERRERQHVVR